MRLIKRSAGRAAIWATAGILVSFSAGVAPALARQGDAEYFYVYQGQKKALRLDTTRIAVLRDADQDARGVDVGGIPAKDVEPHAIAGWSLARTDALAVRQRGGNFDVVQAIESIARVQSVEFVSPVFFDDLGGPMFATPHLLVGFAPGLDPVQARDILARFHAGDVIDENWAGMPGVYRIRSDSRSGLDVLNTANALAEIPGVAWAEPNMVFTGKGALTPNDTGYANCWGIHNTGQFGGTPDQDMDGPEAWDITTGDPDIKVVIIDTGVDQAHPDMNQVGGIDTTSQAPATFGGPANEFDNHGTAVAGCVSAAINNNLGTVGIAPACRAASARTFISTNANGNWTSEATWTVNALTWAETIDARITNNSNYYGFTSNAIANKYLTTRSGGMVHFASAGNDSNVAFISYPASLPTVNAIGALDLTGQRASFSNGGTDLFLSAPGVSVYTTDRLGSEGYAGGDYVFVQGTSFASPYTAGVAALVLSYNPGLSATEVENILSTTAVDRGTPGFDTLYGHGFVNARAALEATPAFSPPGTFTLTSPPSGAVQVIRNPSFTWSASVNATSYTFTLDNDADFSSPIVSTVVITPQYSYAGAPLSSSTVYFWRVVASNSLGNQSSSPASASFTTISLPPAPFGLTNPGPAALEVPLNTTFMWEASARAELYIFRLDDDADFSSPIVEAALSTNSYQSVGILQGNTTYSWSVSAVNALGTVESTPGTASFATITLAPGNFSLLSPADGLNINTATPMLTWSPSPGATSYNITIDDNVDLSSPVVDFYGQPSPSYTVPSGILQSQVRYYWRIRAFNSQGSTVSSPTLFSFGVILANCSGDANGDRLVSFLDIAFTLGNWDGAGPDGDANHDGVVNFVDIATTLGNWGGTCP